MSVLNSRIRDHLANERTFLAWIRTGASIVGLGFVIERLGVFIPRTSQQGFVLKGTAVIGLAMVLIGGMINIYAVVSYVRTHRAIETESYNPSGMSIVIVGIVTVVLSLLAMVLMLLP